VALAIPIFIMSTTILSFVFTWLHMLSKGSVVVAAIVHGALNTMSELTSSRHMLHANQLVVSPFGLTTSIVGVAFVAVMYHRFLRPSWIKESTMPAGKR
jgi:membrane protease YdiL (CAAX protease family)